MTNTFMQTKKLKNKNKLIFKIQRIKKKRNSELVNTLRNWYFE